MVHHADPNLPSCILARYPLLSDLRGTGATGATMSHQPLSNARAAACHGPATGATSANEHSRAWATCTATPERVELNPVRTGLEDDRTAGAERPARMAAAHHAIAHVSHMKYHGKFRVQQFHWASGKSASDASRL